MTPALAADQRSTSMMSNMVTIGSMVKNCPKSNPLTLSIAQTRSKDCVVRDFFRRDRVYRASLDQGLDCR